MEPLSKSVMGGKSPRDLLRVVFRRRKLFLISAALVAAIGMVASNFLPLRYTGTTIFERRVDAAAEELMKGKSDSFNSIKMTLQNDLIGHKALGRVIEQLRLVRPLPQGATPDEVRSVQTESQEIENRWAANIRIDWRITSEQVDTVSLSFTDDDPSLAEKVPNLLVQLYFDNISQEIKTRLKQSCDFLEQRVQEANKSLQEAADRRMKFQAEHAEQFPEPGSFQARVAQKSNEIQTLRPQLDLARQREAQLNIVTSQPTTSQPAQEIYGPNPERARLADELHRVEEELNNSKQIKGMTDKHPYVIGLNKRVADLKTQLEKAPASVKVQELYNVGGGSITTALDRAAVKAEIIMVTNRLAQAQSELDHLQMRAAEFSKVTRDYTDLLKTEQERAEEVRRWNTRLGELQMQLGAEVAQRATHQSTIQPARRQYIPSSPNLFMVIGGTIFSGLAIGAGLVFLAMFLDRSFTNNEEITEILDLPVQGAIGEIVTSGQRRARRVRQLILIPTVSLVLIVALSAATWCTVLRLRDQEKYARLLKEPLGVISTTLYEDILRPARQVIDSN